MGDESAAVDLSRRLDPVVVGLSWCCTRGIVLLLLIGPHAWVQGDLGYFRQSLDALATAGWAGTLVEYPVPGVLVLAVPWLLGQVLGHPEWYTSTFVTSAVLLDAAYLLVLRRFADSWRTWAVASWLLGPPLLGATTYARFDLVPGVLLGVAVLLVGSRPRCAAVAAAAATAVKFWPAVVLPGLASLLPHRWRVVRVVLATGGVLAGLSLAVAGWSRLVSPFAWQLDRGLQIESVPATPAMLGWWQDPGSFTVGYGAQNAYEISGATVPVLLHLTTLAVGVYAAGLVLLWWRVWRTGDRVTADTVAWLALAAVSGFMVTGKVLSPQYLLWLLPVAAAGLALAHDAPRALLRWTALLLVTTVLSQLVFPVAYQALLSPQPTTGAAVLLLALRNLLLVGLSAEAWRRAWRQTEGSGVVNPASASAATISSRLIPRR